ncbi:MAG: serine protease [Myxococcaceae bacterium]|nr:MAG: serine protease [Myxococcaceae bacterium]
MSGLMRLLDPNNLRPVFDALAVGRDGWRGVREDRDFLGVLRRTLLPLPTDREPELDPDPFPPFEPGPYPALRGRKVAVVVSGGSGATSAAVGVQRAFEEAGVEPAALSAASGAVLFTLPWACGLDSATIARFWLGLRREDYVDLDWGALLRSARRGMGGWAGLVRGDALERSLRLLVGDRRLGETRIPFSMPAWNIDRNRVEILGTLTTPDLPVAVAVRTAIAIPIFVEPVQIGPHVYGDGGIIDIFPVRPVLEVRPDLVLGLNCYLPEGFEGEDVTGWRQRSFAILRASGQLRWSGMVALAREQALLAGDRLTLLHPVPYEAVRGGKFYETFVDRRRWPGFMNAGREATREYLSGLAPLRAAG